MLRNALAITLFLTTLSAADAQQNPFVGGWRSIVVTNGMEITISLVMRPDMRFSEQEASYVGVTTQTGTYVVNAGELTLNIEDWQPKTHEVYHPTGTTGGYYTDEPSPQPPGGTYQVQFLSANRMVMREVNFGGEARFDRTR
ncbi:MAG: hypothetical protein WBN22_10330 [Verrucomicrobiia bacterium]